MAVTTNPSADTNLYSVFEKIRENDHEQVVFCHDASSGLKAIIAVHNTVLGPSLGGCRFWNYANDSEAITDVLRLSRGMTFKAAITGLHLGGGKSVIIGDSRTQKSEHLFRRFGKFIESLGGKYITAEDVGTSTRDMEWVSHETKYVTGVPQYMGGSGDPSPFTAYGVYLGMKAAAKKVYGNDSLNRKTIMVQGVGHVGTHLVEHLVKEGAEVLVTDMYDDRLQAISEKYKVQVIAANAVFDQRCDVYSPCALGATINDDSIDKLKCTIVAGAANNQLKDETANGLQLLEKGILYAPDFLINAGGLINVGNELESYNKEKVTAEVEKIYDRTLDIIDLASKNSITTHEAATQRALERLNNIAHLNSRL